MRRALIPLLTMILLQNFTLASFAQDSPVKKTVTKPAEKNPTEKIAQNIPAKNHEKPVETTKPVEKSTDPVEKTPETPEVKKPETPAPPVEKTTPVAPLAPVKEPVKDITETEKEVVPVEEEKTEPIKEESEKVEEARESIAPDYDTPSKNYFINTGIYTGIGLFTPISNYAESYDGALMYSFHTSLYQFTYHGFSPEIHVRYSDLTSKSRTGIVDSTLTLTQFSLGIIYRSTQKWARGLRKYSYFQKPYTVYLRITEGLTHIEFNSDLLQNPETETVNTLEFTVGTLFPVWSKVEAGLDFSYRRVFTAGSHLQGYGVMFVVGVRL